jgi:hypothetical protein
LFGFDETPVNPFSIAKDFEKVKQFLSDIGSSKKYGKALLYFAFVGEDEFKKKVILNLTKATETVLSRVMGGKRIR